MMLSLMREYDSSRLRKMQPGVHRYSVMLHWAVSINVYNVSSYDGVCVFSIKIQSVDISTFLVPCVVT